ncbi:unnamed protein product [Sphagnum tenellum]
MGSLEGAVQQRHRVRELDPHGVVDHVVEPEGAVPGGAEQELGGVGAEADARDAVVGRVLQLELGGGGAGVGVGGGGGHGFADFRVSDFGKGLFFGLFLSRVTQGF